MERSPNNPEFTSSQEKIRKSYIDSIEHIVPFDMEEERTQEEVIGWLRDTHHVTKKESPVQHLGVVALVVSPKMDKVFLLNHKKAGAYLMPGGHVDLGETLQEAIQKELLEELGLVVDMKESNPFYISKILTQGKNAGHHDVTTVFRIIADPATTFSVEAKEADEAGWFDWAELDSMPAFTQLPRIKQKLSIEKLILLDNGGVLSDHYQQPHHKDLADILGVDEEKLKALLSEKSPHGEAYRKNFISREEFWSIVVRLSESVADLDYSQLEKLWAESYQVNSEIVAVLKRYRNVGVKTGVIANSDKYRKQHMEEKHKHSSFLDYSIISSDIGSIKPEKEIYEKAIEQANISPKNIIYVDDRENHAKKATEIGMQGEVFSTLDDLKLKLKKFYRDNR
jgi:HAD superfamily hydrolase (TIGR01509 family)